MIDFICSSFASTKEGFGFLNHFANEGGVMAGARRTAEREAGAAERGARTWRAGAGAR